MVSLEFLRQRSGVWVASVLALAGLGLHLFLFGPLFRQLKNTSRECLAVESDAQKTRDLIAVSKSGAMARSLASEKRISLAIDELAKKGNSSGIRLVSITPRPIETSAGLQYRILPIEIEAESGYKEIGVFLGSLENLKNGLFAVRGFEM